VLFILPFGGFPWDISSVYIPTAYSVTASTSGEKYGNFKLNVENGSGQIRGCTEVDTMHSVSQTVTIGVSGDPTVRSGSNLTIGSVTVSASKA
jgi:hypothetical protein